MDARVRWAVALIAVLALAATACGSGGGTRADDEGAGVAAAVTLGEFTISPAEIPAPEGEPFAIEVTNGGQAPHSFAIEAAGVLHETPMLDPGDVATLELPALEAGAYHAMCTVPGHEEAGMAATLVVGNDASAAMGVGGMTGAAGTGTSGQLGGGMTPEQMAEMHQEGVAAFPAETQGLGGQPLEPVIDHGVKVFELTAQQVRWEVEPGVVTTAFGYDGQVPGPEIRVRPGDRIRFVLQNQLPQPTTIHFHGMTVPNEDDGVPYVTQDPVMPGGYWVYEFTVRDPPGTYVYHSHFNSTEQVGMGLYGALIVEPKKPAWDVESTIFLGDGPLGYTLNGKGFPATQPIVAGRGDAVLIRLANDGSMLHPMHLHGFHFTVVAQDGMALEQPYTVDTLVVAPGQRFDVVVDARYPGVWAFHCHILPHVEGPQGMFGMVTALVVQ